MTAMGCDGNMSRCLKYPHTRQNLKCHVIADNNNFRLYKLNQKYNIS